MSRMERAIIYCCAVVGALLAWGMVAGNPLRTAMRETGLALVHLGRYIIRSAG